MKIIRNSVWSVSNTRGIDDAIYRVLGFYTESGIMILYELSDKKITRPKFFYIEPFTWGIQEGRIQSYDYQVPIWMLASEDEIPEKNRSRRDKNYALVSPLLNDSDFLYTYAVSQRSPLLRQYALRNNVSYQTLRSLLAICWKYGRGKQSLIPAYARSGGVGTKKKVKTVPIGRKKKGRVLIDSRASVYIMRQLDSDNIRKIITKHYLKPEGVSLAECWRIFLGKYFPEVASMKKEDAIPYPSLAQFRYSTKLQFSLDEIARRRTSERNFLLNKRALPGSAANPDTLPGEVFEIDATVADVHLISEFGNILIGRPTVYLIADRATRMITGMHISYLYASWRAAAQALANCFLPKQDYCRMFGVSDISNTRWPCCHVPVKLLCDNAEMLGLKSQKAVVPFTELIFAPSYRADLKSIVESRFHVLNRKAVHKLLGTTRGGFVVRGEEDPKTRACYTLRQFTEIMIRAVDEYNHALNKELVYINPLLLEHDLVATPINSWNISVSKFRFSGYRITEQEVVSRLLYPDQASITAKGIQYYNRFYRCSVEEMIRARNFDQVPIDVRIDDNSMDNIYVRIGKNKVFTRSELLPRRKIFQGKPHMEADIVADVIDIQRERNAITPESIVMQELNEKNEAEGKTLLAALRQEGRGRFKNIKENRREEVRLLQQGEILNSEEEYSLPLANNIFILPGPEARKEWLAKQSDPYKKGE
ncbi:transposase [Yersinia sp. 2544 StPb PI]|uniref:transposase n=1 Tax=Yersinia sp. 2544 StPb PI TaxID=3117409 RepID=UPI003B283BA3